MVGKYANWFDSLSENTKIILLAIPFTGWFNATLYRFSNDHFNAGIVALMFGPIFWIMDLIFYLSKKTLGIWSKKEEIKNLQIIKESVQEDSKDE